MLVGRGLKKSFPVTQSAKMLDPPLQHILLTSEPISFYVFILILLYSVFKLICDRPVYVRKLLRRLTNLIRRYG